MNRKIIILHLAIVLVIFFGAESCPYNKKRRPPEAFQSGKRKTFIRRGTSSSTESLCKGSNYQHAVPTKAGICSAYRNIQAAMDYLLNDNILARSDLFGSAVRLVFHDAGEIDIRDPTDVYGPDGCLASHGGSKGLVEEDSITVTTIEAIWQTMCENISRADFWALFGTIAAERATDNTIDITYQYGRTDNTDCEGGAGRLPSGQGGMEEIQRVFVDQMGLTVHDAVTLLGAHSLGHMHIDVSGYGFVDDRVLPEALNAWDDTPAVLDNDYYVQLLKQKWKSHPATARRDLSQWRHNSNPLIMVNPDIALAYPLSTALPLPNKNKQVCCPAINTTPYGCVNPTNTSVPDTLAQCQSYAEDNARFVSDFAVAFAKMAAVGYGGVPSPADDGATSSGKLGTLTVIDWKTCT